MFHPRLVLSKRPTCAVTRLSLDSKGSFEHIPASDRSYRAVEGLHKRFTVLHVMITPTGRAETMVKPQLMPQQGGQTKTVPSTK